MSDLTNLYQTYLDMSDEKRNSIALQIMNDIFNYLSSNYDEEDILEYVVRMFSVFCCVDGVVNMAEYELFKYTTGSTASYDDFYEATKEGTHTQNIEEFFDVLNNEDSNFISNVFALAICIFTANGTLTVKEQEFIAKYFM